jgi:hypothetical protein
MEKELKLSSKLSFRGWSQDCVSQLLKLETDNEELLKENGELKNALRECIRKHIIAAKENSGQTGDDSQSLEQVS